MKNESFDRQLAVNLTRAYAVTTGLGCELFSSEGERIESFGKCCSRCELCEEAGLSKEKCVPSHMYGMEAAERFGGKYIYCCGMGLTCFVSPILSGGSSAARITVGPFLMVDIQDFLAYDVEMCLHLDAAHREAVAARLGEVAYVPPGEVNELSTLLFMAAGFINNVSEANRMLRTQASDNIQGQISAYIMELKSGEMQPYPFHTERALIRAIAQRDRPNAQKYLNELLGFILFTTGAEFEPVRARIGELLVLLARSAIENGADVETTLARSQSTIRSVANAQNIEELCLHVSGAISALMDGSFLPDAARSNAIHRAIQYVQIHYAQKLTMRDVADAVHLSPSYFGKLFKQETGQAFSVFLMEFRIQKSKALIRAEDMRLADVAFAVGFEDQSYFTKVFKRVAGVSPMQYRTKMGDE